MNTLLLAAGTAAIAVLAAGSGVAQMRAGPPMSAPTTQLPGASMQSAPPVPTSPGATTGSAANTSASDVAVGQTVNDNTGVSVGQITGLTNGANGMATIKMGDQSFQVPASNIYMKNGAATINLTKAQLQAQLPKPPA